jgi:TetR/AcrR family transcriptional regulator, cholesterol catabolism regulator
MSSVVTQLQPASSQQRLRGRPRKTAAEQDDGNRRRQLVTGAAKLFRRHGFDATSTRDIAAAVGMQSGSPFYHFKSKGALLFAVMDEGMRGAILRQTKAIKTHQSLLNSELLEQYPKGLMAVLIKNHFDILLGPGSDFIPVMLYEWRSINPRERALIADLQAQYEAAWIPVLQALFDAGLLKADVKLARLLIFGALNWSAQWFDRRKEASIEDLTAAAMALFIQERT